MQIDKTKNSTQNNTETRTHNTHDMHNTHDTHNTQQAHLIPNTLNATGYNGVAEQNQSLKTTQDPDWNNNDLNTDENFPQDVDLDISDGNPESKPESKPESDSDLQNPDSVTEPYDVNMDGLEIERDMAMEETLREKGFATDQVQALYELADTYMSPLLSQAQQVQQHNAEMELALHFGGQKQWQDVQNVLSKWAPANLPAETVDHLASSPQGIKMMHEMMTAKTEKNRVPISEISSQSEMTEIQLRQMMQDKRYWQHKDADFIKQVQQGFTKLYS